MKPMFICPDPQCRNHSPSEANPENPGTRFKRLEDCMGLKMFECRECNCWFSFNEQQGVLSEASFDENSEGVIEMSMNGFSIKTVEV